MEGRRSLVFLSLAKLLGTKQRYAAPPHQSSLSVVRPPCGKRLPSGKARWSHTASGMQGLMVPRRANMRAAAGTLLVRCLADSGWDRLTHGGGFMQWFAAAFDAVV